ncbi:hypothetical protein [Pseudomonas aeruginosa]
MRDGLVVATNFLAAYTAVNEFQVPAGRVIHFLAAYTAVNEQPQQQAQ